MRFLVDGIMQTSPELPTTVDFGNNLVNYIEVNPEDAHRRRHRHQHSQHSKQHGQHSSSSAAASATTSPTPEDSSRGASRNSSISKDKDDAKAKAAPRIRSVPPPDAYRREIPQYLQDFDQAEESPAYQRAVTAIEKLPTPPSLPGFLGKPILNAAVLMKDDNSVLGLPNHTVLNHLATSSIKNGVLAVSATTRYRNKVCLHLLLLIYHNVTNVQCSM